VIASINNNDDNITTTSQCLTYVMLLNAFYTETRRWHPRWQAGESERESCLSWRSWQRCWSISLSRSLVGSFARCVMRLMRGPTTSVHHC